MKKSKLSIGLVTSFIGALALSSCGSEAAVTKSKNSIVDFIGYNSETDRIEINVDELYRECSESKEGTTLYYNAILEALSRYEYPLISAQDSTLKPYATLESEANDKLRAVQQTAKDNAKNNGTKYDEEWDKILDNNNVETTEDLRLKFLYELEKEALSEWYFRAHSESTDVEVVNNDDPDNPTTDTVHTAGLREQFLGVTDDWKDVAEDQKTKDVDPVYPYHILHILVTLSADKSDYVRGTISQEEAENLWQTVRNLINGDFIELAAEANINKDNSNKEFGDVGYMSTATSFYNEFKLGIYAYDAILSKVNSQTENNKGIYNAFGIGKDLNGQDATIVTQTLETGEERAKVVEKIQSEMVTNVNLNLEAETKLVPAVPFDVFRQIGELADKDKIGNKELESGDASLPRNVLFNAFLNFHSPFVITNELLDPTTVSITDTSIDNKIATTTYDFDDASILKIEDAETGVVGIDATNFKSGKLGSEFTKRVLCDKEENVVIGVRSESGIHFMVMKKSVFENTNKKVGKEGTSLLDYYTTKLNSDGQPVDNEGEPLANLGKETYVNLKSSDDVSYYTNRANSIKSDIKSTDTFDAAYDYRVYEALLDFEVGGEKIKNKLHFSDEDPDTHESVLRNNIDKNIELLREGHHENRYNSINSAWQTYLLMLINQNKWRSDANEFKGAFVPTTCAFTFDSAHADEWKEGGNCYVKK